MRAQNSAVAEIEIVSERNIRDFRFIVSAVYAAIAVAIIAAAFAVVVDAAAIGAAAFAVDAATTVAIATITTIIAAATPHGQGRVNTEVFPTTVSDLI